MRTLLRLLCVGRKLHTGSEVEVVGAGTSVWLGEGVGEKASSALKQALATRHTCQDTLGVQVACHNVVSSAAVQ